MAKRNVVDFRIVNIPDDDTFEQLEEQGKVDPNAMYVSPDTSLKEKHITNCITEIPQDIKMELVDGAVVLKAGSKGYRPNGAGVFNQITARTDISKTTSTDGVYMVVSWGLSSLELVNINSFFSGATQPVNPPRIAVWYDTINNVIKQTYDSGATWSGTLLFPLGIVTVSNGSVSSIDQVFNGFGYIGSCVFTLPKVKGLYPNGRNKDGTLKNGLINCTTVQVSSNFNDTVEHTLMINPNGRCAWYSTTGWYYNDIANIMVASTGTVLTSATLGTFKTTNGVISNFNPHEVFHAVDYSEYKNTISSVDSSAVHKTGNETIGGEKTFTNIVKMQGQYLHFYGIDSTATQSFRDIDAYDTNGKIVGGFRIEHSSINGHSVSLITRKADGTVGGILNVSTKPDGTYSSSAPTPASASNSTEIATTAWANTKFLPLVGGTISGVITTKSQIIFENASSTGHRGFLYKTSDGAFSMGISKSDNSGWQSYQSFFTNGLYTMTVSDGTNSKQLIARPDGTLTWDGNPIVRLIAKQDPTYSNNHAWYRKYSDGWVEQGGRLNITSSNRTITFPVPMANKDNYNLQATVTSAVRYACVEHDTHRTTTGFKVATADDNTVNNDGVVDWKVFGYAAQ